MRTPKIIIQLIGLFLFFSLAGSVQAEQTPDNQTSPGNHRFEITVDGQVRNYLVHIPLNFGHDRPAPVVIVFHGGGGKAKTTMIDTGWDRKADLEGFLAVFPNGTPQDPSKPPSFTSNPQSWNDGSGRENLAAVHRNVDDVKFVKSLVQDLSARFKVDQKRIYATGFSNGAAMSFRLGRELSEIFAAIAPVASSDFLIDHEPKHPIPLLYITGKADPLNPFDGGPVRIGQKDYGVKPPVKQSVGNWVRMLDCPEKPEVIHDENGVLGLAYKPCRGESEVVFYTVEGLGHWWPGFMPPAYYPEWLMRLLGKPSDKLQATDLIWEFFMSHAKK